MKPQKYDIIFVKAHDRVFGRETIDSMAKRIGADIAINAGFFEIGDSQDGMPSGTLIINGQILGFNLKPHACLSCDQGKLNIQKIKPSLKIKIEENTFHPNKINKFPAKKDTVLYSHLWGAHTLTPLEERKEIAIDSDGTVVGFSMQGNSAIPQNGFVLSLPIDHLSSSIPINTKADIDLAALSFSKEDKKSLVMGIPALIQEGKINPEIEKNQASFYQAAHARTAVGMRSNGDVIIVVAEHVYRKPLKEITLDEVKSIIENNKLSLVKKYGPHLQELTLTQLKEIIGQALTNNNAIGLTLPELAHLMGELGCESAINLDGGGSSSLYINHKIVNHTIGDQDEGMGQTIVRPISDAIVFKRVPG